MQVETRLLTIAEYMAEFARRPIEIVNGEIVEMSPQTRRQPNVVTNLFRSLDPFVHQRKLGKVFAEASYVLDADPHTNWVTGARTPDLSFITRQRIETHNAQYPDPDEPWRLAPDLAAEVVSPSDSYTDISQKVADYLRYGVRLIWIIDPRQRTVRVHTPDQPTGYTLRETDTISAEPVIEGWSMLVADLFVED